MEKVTSDTSSHFPSTANGDHSFKLEPARAKGNLDDFQVQFLEGDPENPKNWANAKRWYITIAAAVLVLNATFASSAPSGIIPLLIDQFHLSHEPAVLTISLFVAGYCVGPLFWGPLSEQYGRRPVFIISFFCYACFQVAAALAKSGVSLLIFRFLGGTFASAPLANSGAIISDLWDAKTRGQALAVFALAPFAGPALGPTVGGYLLVAGVSWRWLFWILTIFASVCWLMIIFTMPETYAPVLLVKKAKKMRKETKDQRYYAPMERQTLTISQRLESILARPFKILFLEPMLIAITVYMSFVYGCVYLLFEAYPVVFTEGHHLNSGATGLMFLPIPVGGLIAVICYLTIFNPRYEREAARFAPNPVPPEFRLEIAVLAAPLLVIAFFWFAWTSFPSITFWAPMLSGALMGLSICWIFLSMFNYIIDVYLYAAASALAANTVVRSIFGAVFPLFGSQLYEALGARWASSLVGFVALVLMPIPFVLIKFGPMLRRKSKFSPTLTPDEPKQSEKSQA